MIQTLTDLCELIDLAPEQLPIDYHSPFALKVPQHFANQIEKGNPNDPLLRQILPDTMENQTTIGFNTDPVGDLQSNPTPSLIHKYHGRALLITSPKCDIHCRYCFRRHFPYEQAKKTHWQTALDVVEQDESIEEIIFSGGDPFALAETAFLALLSAVEAIPHLTTLRIHSRTPVAAPNRAAREKTITALANSRLQVVLVVHCNHPNELSPDTAALMQRYRDANITLLNQTVLLKGVNDSIETLTSLSKALFAQGILPYYCHLLDKVAGASHFEVKNYQAWYFLEGLRANLPGYLVPKFVQEVAGEAFKQPFVFEPATEKKNHAL